MWEKMCFFFQALHKQIHMNGWFTIWAMKKKTRRCLGFFGGMKYCPVIWGLWCHKPWNTDPGSLLNQANPREWSPSRLDVVINHLLNGMILQVGSMGCTWGTKKTCSEGGEDWGTLGKIKGITSMCGVTGVFFECLQARSDEMRSAVNQLLDREILGRLDGWIWLDDVCTFQKLEGIYMYIMYVCILIIYIYMCIFIFIELEHIYIYNYIHVYIHIWLVLSDEQMSKRWQFSLLNDEQMSNWLGVKHLPDIFGCYL